MRKYLIVFIVGILLVPTVFYLYLSSGHAPVATSASPLPFERFFARLAMHATLDHELPKSVAGPPTEAELESGAHLYLQDCAVCHGLPNEPPTAISKGMYPHPPQFFRPDRPMTYNSTKAFRPPNRKAYWKIKNGVRLTGMPGFKDSLTEQQLWEVSQFVGNARNLPSKVVAVLKGEPERPPQSTSASPSKYHRRLASNKK